MRPNGRPYPRRRAERSALPRSRRREVAGGGNRYYGLASDRQPAGAFPPRGRNAAFPGASAGGSVETLRSFLNVRSDADFVLVVAWALACLRNRGPYPVIVLSGEQGSAKSTFSAICGRCSIPNRALARPAARGSRPVHRRQQRPCARLRQCVGSAGVDFRHALPAGDRRRLRCAPALHRPGRSAVRRHPAGDPQRHRRDRHPARSRRPRRVPDAGADPEEHRRPEQELWAAFEAARPRILGVLLDAVVEGLKRLPETRLEKLPRMADFALWATACETALWPAGTFWSAYCGNRDEAVEGVIDADPIATAVRAMMATRTVWTGTASDLLGALAR